MKTYDLNCSDVELDVSPNCRSLTNEWLDSIEAAAYLKVSPGALRNMASNGDVPFYKLGRRNRYLKADLDMLLFSNRKGKA